MTMHDVADSMLGARMSLRDARKVMTQYMVEAALRKTKGNKVQAATLLRLHRNTLDRHLADQGIDFRVFKYPGLESRCSNLAVPTAG